MQDSYVNVIDEQSDLEVLTSSMKENDELTIKVDKLKQLTEELYERYNIINSSNIRSDLANTIIAATQVYEKVNNAEIKKLAEGLVVAAIGKLHMEVDKI